MDLGRAVHGLDATAAQTFGTLFNMLEGLGVEMVITHMENPEMEKLLRAHGVIGSNCCMCVPLSLGLLNASIRDLGFLHHLALFLEQWHTTIQITYVENGQVAVRPRSHCLQLLHKRLSTGGCSLFGKCRIT